MADTKKLHKLICVALPFFVHILSDDSGNKNVFTDRKAVKKHKVLKNKTKLFVADRGKLFRCQGA